MLAVGSGSVSLHQTLTLCILVRVFAQDVLKKLTNVGHGYDS